MHSFMPTSSPIVCLNNFNQVSHQNTEQKQPSSKPRMTSFSFLNLATSTFSSSLTLHQLSTLFSSPIWNQHHWHCLLPFQFISLKYSSSLVSITVFLPLLLFTKGMIQGSIVGPLLFSIYSFTLHSITQYKHQVPFHRYVDCI